MMSLMNLLSTSILFLSYTNAQVVLPLHPTAKNDKIPQNRLNGNGPLRKNPNNDVNRGVQKNLVHKNSIVYSHFEIFHNIPNGESTLRKFKTYFEQKHALRLASLNNRFTQHNLKEMSASLSEPHPLFQGLGSHYVTIYVGTPPQRTTVLVDTGSHRTAFPCDGCTDCGEGHHTDTLFQPQKSSTFHKFTCDECKDSHCSGDRCQMNECYMEGSIWEAYQASDKIFMSSYLPDDSRLAQDSTNSINFVIGCETGETGLFLTQLENGIMGMAETEFQFPKNLFQQKKIPHDAFALCFGWEDTVSENGVHSGMMTLGGVDTRHHKAPMVYAKRALSTKYYNVFLSKIYLQKGEETKTVTIPASSNRVNNYGEGIMVDSGTTYTFLPREIGQGFGNAWKELTGIDYTNEPMSAGDANIFPTILLQLTGAEGGECKQGTAGLAGSLDPENCNDVIVSVPPSHYLYFADGKWTSHLYFSGSKIIGANVIQGHDVLFDSENGRLGFAESSCDYSVVDSTA